MQAQSLRSTLLAQLSFKSSQSPTYRKALTIYNSILDSARDIPGFDLNYANTDSNFGLFVFGSVVKLLMKGDQSFKSNVDGMLMLINMTMHHINISTIKNNGILSALQNKVYSIITDSSHQKTPLLLRLAISILSYTLINTPNPQSNPQSTKLLQQLFTISIQSHRTNILSKQSAKMLTHLVKANPNISKILARYATMNMLANIDDNLYLNNVRDVIMEFPMQLVNDIGYRVSKHLVNVQCTNEDEEVYLAQTYFLLEKLANKFSLSTLQEICKQFINNVPSTNTNESKILFCYIQALHTIFQSLMLMNEKSGNKYLCTVVSILEEFITKGGRVQKQAVGVLRAIMGTCIRKSLWVGVDKMGEEDDFEDLNLEQMGLEQKRKGSNFSRVICMLQGLLSEEYPNHKATASILTAFFDSLDKTALQSVLNLVDKIVNFRQKFDDKSYKKLIQSIFGALSIENLCKIYKIGVDGDISDENYESNNNLWLVYCTQKYDGQQQFPTFMTYYYPLLLHLKSIINPTNSSNLSPIRIEAYKSLIQMFWRCLKVFCRNPNPTYSYQQIIQLIKSQISQANDSTLDHISMALESLCSGLWKKEYQCKWAGSLISLLAKNLNIQKNNSKQILRAMKYLSSIADKQYMTKVFDKNIVKLIQQKQQGTLNNPDNVDKNMKNLQILIAVSNGINFYDPSVVAPYRISREELVVKLIENLLDENSLFQKKAYKHIHETLPLMGSSYLNQVVQLLQAHQHKIMPASKHYRLAILMHLWTKLSQDQNKINQSFQFMKKYLPEILLNMRESNQRTRKQATNLFQSFCKKIVEMGLMENFVEIMCAGLAVDSVDTKISTLQGLVEIYVKKYELSLQFSVGILQIVLMLLYQQKSQIYKAIIEFCRRFIFSFQKTKQINHILSTVLQQLFKADLASKLENRSILKHFLLKLTKRFGRDTIEKLIPAEDRKILGNAIKTENREKRKKKERQVQRRLELAQAKKQKQQEESSDDQNEIQPNQQQNQNQMAIEQQNELKQLNPDNLLLKYDLQQQNFHFEQDKYHIKSRQKKQKNQQNKEADPISFENGMMIVKEDPKRKREQRIEDQSEKEEETQARNYVNVKKRRKLNDVHDVKESGATYKSNRAGGDLQLKDKPSPHAFIQFNSKALNKRFKKRAEKVFDTVFERGEGGLKGIKSKIANRRH